MGLTNPEAIGRRHAFHKAVFEYCIASKSTREFDVKVFFINIICIRMYFKRLKGSDESPWYRLAGELHAWDPERDTIDLDILQRWVDAEEHETEHVHMKLALS